LSTTPEKAPVADPTWNSPEGEAPDAPRSVWGWVTLVWRLPITLIWVFGGLVIHLTVRLIERPIFGLRRPMTPFITQVVCKGTLLLLAIPLRITGKPMRGRGAVVANHVSWLDIFALNAPQRVYFVSKSEVASWPGIGWLARATGTVFIRRSARDARLQKEVFEARLRAGHHLCFFPEGTNSDGVRLLPFKPTLFAAFFTHGLSEILSIQPVTLVYIAPPGRDARFYGWWGELPVVAHILRVVSQPRQGRIEVVFHEPVPVADFADRKELARYCEGKLRADLTERLPEGVLRGP
jgi:1-acyl-sn-glycerol-3-phosphate acyltransferase